MDEDRLLEVQAELHGIRLVLAMVVNSLPAGHDLDARLEHIEGELRKQNALAGTMEVLSDFRAMLRG